MLNTLLESNARRTRRSGGTVASTLVHAALFAGAITVTSKASVATPLTTEVVDSIFVYRPPEQPPRIVERPSAPTTTTAPSAPRLQAIDHVPDELPPIDPDVNVPVASNEEVARGTIGPAHDPFGGSGPALSGPPDGALDERYVDRSPRMIGTPTPPVFPASLRERGREGRVLVQFVVDTLGRAESGGLRIVEASDSLFAQSVRAVLPRYRFTPGEVGGQKVRTLVQLPFDFTLVR